MDPSLIVLAVLVFIAAFWIVKRLQHRNTLNSPGKPTSTQRAPSSPRVSIRISPELDSDLRALMMGGQKIKAIKLLRQFSGLGLKESKDYVEALERQDIESSSHQP